MNAIPSLCGTALLAAICLFSSCKDKSTPTEPYLSVEQTEITLDAGLSLGTIPVGSNQSWTAEVDPAAATWLAAFREGDELIIKTTDYNRSPAERSAVIMLKTTGEGSAAKPITTQVTVIQQGALQQVAALIARSAWSDAYPSDISGTKVSVSSDPIRLSFFGWGTDNDHKFALNFPADHTQYKRAILKYRMGAWNQGASPWDVTTSIRIKDKGTGEWYELTRAFTPYGGSFGSSWERYFYFDVTDFLPLLENATEFRVYYDGFDATDTRAHTATLTFDLYEGSPGRNTVYTAKVYDSEINDNTGYRKWAYGFADQDIEGVEWMGERRFTIPADVKSLTMQVTITGHGHDQGKFPDRAGYSTNNAAEFDRNTYTIKVNGKTAPYPGTIFTSCKNNYQQSGTYIYDRANWCPGNPAITNYWQILDIPQEGGEMTLDIDLERFISQFSKPGDNDGSARYMVTVDLFGFDK